MPWIIRPGGDTPWGEEQTKHLPTPKYDEWQAKLEAWEVSDEGIVGASDIYLRELKEAAPIKDRDRMPKTILWKKRGKLKDCVAFFEHFVLSPRVQDLIEELEPGVQEFLDVDLVNIKTSESWPKSYRLLHVRNVLTDAFDEAQTDPGDGKFGFKPDAIEGLHLWKHHPFGNTYFASDSFVTELQARGIEGIGATPVKGRGE